MARATLQWNYAVLLLLSFLATISQARNSAWEDPSGNSIFDPYKSHTAPRGPVEAWERDGECDPIFFEFSEDNVIDSGVVQWYPVWISKMKARYPDKYLELGEVRFFSELAWGDSNFMCGIMHKGCTPIPVPKAIAMRMLHHSENSNSTLLETLQEARRIYFMGLEISSIANYIFYELNLFQAVKNDAMGLIDGLIADFTQQPDPEADQICSILVTSYMTLLDLGSAALNSFGGIAPHIMQVVNMGETIMELVINTATQISSAPSVNGGIPLGKENQEGWTEEEKDLAKARDLKLAQVVNMLQPFQQGGIQALNAVIGKLHKHPPGSENAPGKVTEPWLQMSPTAATGFCSGLGGGLNNENAQRAVTLKQYVQDAFPQIQIAIQENLDSAVNWTNIEKASPWASWLANHNESIHSQNREWQHDETRATQRYLDSLISIAWRSGHCYQKCLCDPEIDRNKYKNPKQRTAKYRYYPEDGSNCVCQPQCWHSTKRSPYEKRLFGIKALGKYSKNITDISRMSYNYYRANSNNYTVPNMDVRFDPPDKDAGISLPHCVSKQLLLGDWNDESKGWRGKLIRNHNRRFPCTCGNWQSDETEEFMRIFNMNGGGSWMSSHVGDELFMQICPENLKHLPPLNHYLAMCRLGIRWPHNGEIMEIRLHKNKHCDAITSFYNTPAWLSHEREANAHFCRENPDAKSFFHGNRLVPSINTSPGFIDPGYSHKCKAWLSKVEGKGKHREKITIPKELIWVSVNGTVLPNYQSHGNGSGIANGTVGSGVFRNETLDDGPVPTTLIVEESAERFTVDNYEYMEEEEDENGEEPLIAMETSTASTASQDPEDATTEG